jgi:hypothetical protein
MVQVIIHPIYEKPLPLKNRLSKEFIAYKIIRTKK